MTVTQYIGARYVPIFADEPWSSENVYEPLTIVQYQGNSFTSRQAVPAGIDINNTEYWAESGNYNAQVEAYRQEVRTFDSRITANAAAISAEETARIAAVTAEETARAAADTALAGDITSEANSRAAADTALQNNINAKEDTKNYIAVIGDSFSTSNSYKYWPQIVSETLGYTIINEARNSAGFTTPGSDNQSTFIQQLQRIENNANFDKIKCIIVYGGVNDFQSNASVVTMVNALDTFYGEYNSLENKPPIYMMFGNIGYAQRSHFDGFYEWYTALAQYIERKGYAGFVNNVAYWHFNLANQFNNDLIHPNEEGQKVIAQFIMQCLNGTYTGVQRTQWFTGLTYAGNNYTSKNVVHFDNGLVTVSIVLNSTIPLTNIQANTFIDLGRIASADQYSLMFGGDSQNNKAVWKYDSPVLLGTNGTGVGSLMPMFNVSNQHLYLNMFGVSDWISGGSYGLNDKQFIFTIYPTGGIV